HLHEPDVVRFAEELQPAGRVPLARLALAGAGPIAEDLAAAGRPAAGAGEVELAVAEIDPLAAGEPGRPLGVAAVAQVLVGVVDAVEVDPADAAPIALAPVGRLPVARIGVSALGKGQRLQPAARWEPRPVVGQVAVE